MQNRSLQKPLILSSSSVSRRELLTRLKFDFTYTSPEVDETPLPSETAPALVLRLAKLKAEASETTYPDALIIGADQVGVVDDCILGKPLTLEAAKASLEFISGKTVRFYTGLCVYDSGRKHYDMATETYDVSFRTLSNTDIDHYLKLEQPLHCAGSFHVEGLGISLIRELHGNDYTALIGLPLIRLTEMLAPYSSEM